MIIDGIAASQAIDTSGEQILIENLDISSLEEGTGAIIYEHKSPKDPGASPLDILGSVTYAKKILKQSDCSNDRERSYWKQIELPFLYIKAELFDQEEHPGSQALAAIINFYHRRKLPILMRFSIDGNTLERDKDNPNILKTCIARDIAITVRPCNQSCISGVLEDDLEAVQDGQVEEIEKSNGFMHRLPGVACWVMPDANDPMQIIKNEQEFLNDSEDLVKTMTAGNYDAAPTSLTQGAAMQKEDFATRKRAVRRLQASCRDWDGKGSLKDHLEKTLADVHPQFIEKFCDALDSFHLKKAADLNALLDKAVSGDVTIGATNSSQNSQSSPNVTQNAETNAATNPTLNNTIITTKPKKKKRDLVTSSITTISSVPPTASAVGPIAAGGGFAKSEETPLTVGGAVVQPNPGMMAPVFDSVTSSLVTPRGNFKLQIPEVGDHHLLARANAGRRLAASKPSDSLRLAALMIGADKMDHEIQPILDSLKGVDVNALHDKFDSLGFDPKSSRLTAALMGAGNVLVPGDECLGSMFGLGTKDADSHEHLHDTLGSSHRLLQDVEGHLGRTLNGTDLQDAVSAWALNDESNGDPAVKVVADVLKSEGSANWTLARRVKDLFARWQQRYGQAKARMLYMTHLVPILTASSEGLAKAEDTDTLYKELSGEDAPKFVNFRGKRVTPGKVTFHAGHLAGKEFPLLGEEEHRYIVQDHENLGRPMGIPKNDEGRAYKVTQKPQAVQSQHLTDASHHVLGSDPNLGVGIDFHPEALLDYKYAKEGIHAERGTPPFFTQNALGQRVFVKPDGERPWAEAEGVPTPVRESAVKNVADFLGLGAHVPATSTIKHPKTGDLFSVQEVVKRGGHTGDVSNRAPAAEKLSVLDFITGQVDRHPLNFMTTDSDPGIHLIDNGYSFRYHGLAMERPGYVDRQNMDKPFRPDSHAWISGIDPKGLAETMAKSGLNEKHIKAAVSRLTFLKLLTASGQPVTHKVLAETVPEGK